MSGSAVAALRKAIRVALTADAILVGKLGEPRIYDEALRGGQPPYITFGDATMRDWSTGSDVGSEQFAVINVWSTQRGLREALDLSGDVQRILHDASFTLDGHRLVDIRFISGESRRESSGRFAKVSLRFRAVTEQI